jgi:uncharacterized OsmC-like protein
MLDTTSGRRINHLDMDALEETVAAVQAEPPLGVLGFQVSSRWAGQCRSEHQVTGYSRGGEWIERAFTIAADEPEELLGTNSAPNPQELLLSALNACMLVGYVAGASVKGIELDLVEIDTHGELDVRGFFGLSDQVPAGMPQIDYTVRIKGQGSRADFEEIHAQVMATSPNFYHLANPIRLNGKLELA